MDDNEAARWAAAIRAHNEVEREMRLAREAGPRSRWRRIVVALTRKLKRGN